MIKKIIVFILFCFTLLSACSEPVFRYALKNWRPESYNLFVFYDSKLNTNDSILVKYTIEEARTGRLSVLKVKLLDVNNLNYENSINSQVDKSKLPYCVLGYPSLRNDVVPIWSGEFNRGNVEKILYSPARKEIAKRILSGEAGVWLVINDNKTEKKSILSKLLNLVGIKSKNKILKILDKNIKHINNTFRCPGSPTNNDDYNPEDSVSVTFSTYQLDINDPEEEIFISMLTKLNNKDKIQNNALIFPIFGRGRTLPVITDDELNKEKIFEVATFLSGPCACIVKAENPGVDILFTISWVNRKTNYEVFAIIEDAPLNGIGNFTKNEFKQIDDEVNEPFSKEAHLLTSLEWILLISISLILIFSFAIVSFLIIKKRRHTN